MTRRKRCTLCTDCAFLVATGVTHPERFEERLGMRWASLRRHLQLPGHRGDLWPRLDQRRAA